MNEEHIYGGPWTASKYSILKQYLDAYTIVFKNQTWVRQTVYIDAFAGTGTWSQKDQDGSVWSTDGSARIALNCSPPFSEYIFIELDKKHIVALEKLKDEFPDRNIRVISGDTNTELVNFIQSKNWDQTRGVLFLDPYDMALDWDVLLKIAATRVLDVWYLFPYAGVFRQASNDKSKIEDYKKRKLEKILGTSEWEKAFYPASQGDFFDQSLEIRISIEAIEAWLRERLQHVFPSVSSPLVIKNSTNAPMFLLYFCVSNPSGPAIGAATRIAKHILKQSTQ